MRSADNNAARSPAITREALAAAGLTILRREGLDALSMRKVAAELGVQAASLYYHVQDKEQLLDLLADSLVWDGRTLKGAAEWDVCLREMANAYARHLRANRDAARLMAGRIAPGPNLLYVLDFMVGQLRAGGFSERDAARATFMVANYVQGYVLQEQLPKPERKADGAEHSVVIEAFRTASADQYPNVAALADVMADHGKGDLFGFGIDSIIDGLRARLTAEPAS